MSNLRLPTRRAPTIEEAGLKNGIKNKDKKPPPRPPPPNFSKIKSKSAWTLNQSNTNDLIEWSPPSSPTKAHRGFGGSISSSFSSSTSSLSSSKKSSDNDSLSNWYLSNVPVGNWQNADKGIPPTIIRPLAKKVGKEKSALPTAALPPPGLLTPVPVPVSASSSAMPKIPPPSPPKDTAAVVDSFGIALFDYQTDHKEDLEFRANDIVYLIRKVNKDWYFGRIEDREGLFPASFVDIQVPLPDEDKLVTALYDFVGEEASDLSFQKGDAIKVIGKVSSEWLLGERNGRTGQFPANFIDRVPDL